MKPEKQNENREYKQYKSNTKKAYDARNSISNALSDSQWHRNLELISTTKLSSRTLDKHLNQLVKSQLIEKKKDVIDGKYAVLYKATPDFMSYIWSNDLRKKFSDNIDGMLEETKNPLIILDLIHQWSQINFTLILKEIQKDKNVNWDDLNYIEEFYLWDYYRYFTMKLIAATTKIIDKLDINQLTISHANYHAGTSNMIMKHFEELVKK